MIKVFDSNGNGSSKATAAASIHREPCKKSPSPASPACSTPRKKKKNKKNNKNKNQDEQQDFLNQNHQSKNDRNLQENMETLMPPPPAQPPSSSRHTQMTSSGHNSGTVSRRGSFSNNSSSSNNKSYVEEPSTTSSTTASASATAAANTSSSSASSAYAYASMNQVTQNTNISNMRQMFAAAAGVGAVTPIGTIGGPQPGGVVASSGIHHRRPNRPSSTPIPLSQSHNHNPNWNHQPLQLPSIHNPFHPNSSKQSQHHHHNHHHHHHQQQSLHHQRGGQVQQYGSSSNNSANSVHHRNTPSSLHIPWHGGPFGKNQGKYHGNSDGMRVSQRMQTSADYFSQFQHFMYRGQQDTAMPTPPPIVPHQYYNYIMHAHHLNKAKMNDCQSMGNSPTRATHNNSNGKWGMEGQGIGSELKSPMGNKNCSDIMMTDEYKSTAKMIDNGPSIPIGDAWTANKSSDLKNLGYRILEDPSTSHLLCSICCKKNGRLCTACGHVAYCSIKCQTLDWPRHKHAECKPPVTYDKGLLLSSLKKRKGSSSSKESSVSDDETVITVLAICEEIGSGDGPDVVDKIVLTDTDDKTLLADDKTLTADDISDGDEKSEEPAYTGKFIARRLIKKGESIYSVKPIMMASNDKDLAHPPDSILCLECCRWYQASTGYRCSKCTWPVCSLECENGPLHSKFECPVFVNNSILPPPVNDSSQFYDDAILALRVIMMKVHLPERFEELLEWKDVEKSLSKTSKWMDYDSRMITFLIDSCNIFQLVKGLTSEDIQTILTLIDASSVIMDDRVAFREKELERTFHCAKYVIPNRLLLHEECSPNCKWSIQHGVEVDACSLRINAATDIQPGTLVSVCFSSIWKYGASFIHRYDDCRFDFICSCPRCKDPSEFGSFFSAIKCRECDITETDGYMLPINPSNALTDWLCQNKNCKAILKGQIVIEDLNRLNARMNLLQNDYWQLVGFIFQNNFKVLHPNHYLLFKACWSCLELFWGSLKGLPFFSQRYEFFNSCTHVAKKALTVLDIILPGASIQRGRILFLLSLAEAYRTLRDYRRYMEWGGEDLKKCIARPFWTIQNIQREAFEILMTEPYGSMEHRISVMLQDTIEDQIDLLCHSPLDVPLEHMLIYVLHKIYTRFTSAYYEPSIPLFEDEDISKFVVSTGPVASHLVTSKFAEDDLL